MKSNKKNGILVLEARGDPIGPIKNFLIKVIIDISLEIPWN